MTTRPDRHPPPPGLPADLRAGQHLDGPVRWLTCTLGHQFAACTTPDGRAVVSRARVPLYDLARQLDALGFGGWYLQAFARSTLTPSLRGRVGVMAGLTVEERDQGGLRLRRYRPFSLGRSGTAARNRVEGANTPAETKTASCAPRGDAAA